MKIATLILYWTPHYVARFSAVVQQFPEVSLHSIEVKEPFQDYPWKSQSPPYARTVLSKIAIEAGWKLGWRTWKTLNQLDPDAVAIAGYADLPMLVALLWCLWKRRPAILFSDSKGDDARRRTWKEIPKRWLIQQYTAAVVAGKPHQRYMMSLGMSSEAIFLGCDVINNAFFHPSQLQASARPIQAPYFLAINRFVWEKNLPNLIAAYARYCQQSDRPWDFVICGDGELRSTIEAQIQACGLSDRIHLPGFLDQDEMLPYLAHAECFVLGSIQETWGLVVNEAMAAGLPILLSERCGCAEDLLVQGVNGFGFDPTDPDQIAQFMLKLSSSEVDLEQMGTASLRQIETFSPELFAESLIAAASYRSNHSAVTRFVTR